MSGEITVLVDGRPVRVPSGSTLLAATASAGCDVPTLCHDPRLDPMGSCRMCLVEVKGQRRLQPACAYPATDGAEVTTNSDRIQRHRQVLLSMYLADHRLDADGLPAQAASRNELREHVLAFGTGPDLPHVGTPRGGREDANPYIHFDPDTCIACARCVRYCDEVEAVSAITLAGRGASTTIATADDRGLLETSCELCGGCIATCPTGAMSEKKSVGRAAPAESVVRSTCNFCGVGCQLDLHVDGGKVVKVSSPPPGETVNDGNLCVKGRFAYEFIHHEDRLTQPLIRGDDGQLHPTTWEHAIAFAAEGLMRVRDRHGPDALGFISSSRCTGEENYLVQKLSRAAFGTNNCHQCAAT